MRGILADCMDLCPNRRAFVEGCKLRQSGDVTERYGNVGVREKIAVKTLEQVLAQAWNDRTIDSECSV